MSLISFTPLQDGVTGVNAAATNNPLNTIYDDYNGNITDANIASNAAIAGSKISFASISNPYKFSVYRNASYTSVNTTPTVLPFDTKTFDTGSNVDVVTNKGRFTASVAGFYFFTAGFQVTSNVMHIMFYKNGSLINDGQIIEGISSSVISLNASCLLQLSANDYIEVYYSINGTNAITTGAPDTYFQGYLISAT